MQGITKRFPGVLANDAVDFEAAAGEVHALLGENGAGKSTILKILRGVQPPTSGSVEIGGTPLTTFTAEASRAIIVLRGGDGDFLRTFPREQWFDLGSAGMVLLTRHGVRSLRAAQ